MLEPEVMAGEDEASSYASAAALAYLGKIDDSFVDHFYQLGTSAGRVLDVGTGPGVIPIKIARRSSDLEVVGIDLSEAMLDLARNSLKDESSDLTVSFEIGNASHLEYDDTSFDAVISNSVLHHLEDPVPALNEMARVVKPGGAVLIRDIRRPPGTVYPLWAAFFGRYYEGTMLRSYKDSLKAAFTRTELVHLVQTSNLDQCKVFRHGLTHIGIERYAE